MRLSIEVTSEQHQLLKAIAALKGMTLKDYLLSCALPAAKEGVGISIEILKNS